MLSPEESALALYEGLTERHQDDHIYLREALSAIAALILAERVDATMRERERCAQIAESFIPSGFRGETAKASMIGVARDDRARTIAYAIRHQ